ncbi:MAG: helix-turn-helix transcriptional regulator [Lentisphaeria bacterium]|nr:AraC family transcriptional regulator [Lentisphaeria bacterium]NQZ70845.1 helix-turn-helix transcriptional regulator [Lentisphaeria bacterium]
MYTSIAFCSLNQMAQGVFFIYESIISTLCLHIFSYSGAMDSVKEISSLGSAIYDQGSSYGPRINEYFLFFRVNQGSAVWQVEGISHAISPGTILCSLPGTREKWLWDKKETTVHDYIHWDFNYIPKDLPDLENWPVQVSSRRQGVLHTLFDHILGLSYSRNPLRNDLQKQSLATMISTFVHETDVSVTSFPFHRVIEKCLDALGERWGNGHFRPPSIADLCAIANISKPQLIRIFKHECGESPVRFCEQLRLHWGAHILVTETESIEHISSILGYESQFHFSRNFKNNYKLSPLKFRKLHRLHPEALSDKDTHLLRAYYRVQHVSKFGRKGESIVSLND